MGIPWEVFEAEVEQLKGALCPLPGRDEAEGGWRISIPGQIPWVV